MVNGEWIIDNGDCRPGCVILSKAKNLALVLCMKHLAKVSRKVPARDPSLLSG